MTEDFVCLDLETTGLNPKLEKIIQIGAVRFRNKKASERFESLVNPGRQLNDFVTGLTGIGDGELKNAPDIEEVLPALLSFLGEDVLVGHNISFDYSFIKKAAVNMGLTFEKTGIDTLKLARRFLPQLESRKLEALSAYYGIPCRAHRAASDAEASGMLYLKLAEQFYEKEIFRPSALRYHVKKDQPASQIQKERLYRLVSRHKLTMDRDIEKMTRSEVSRCTDQILSKYGR